MSDGHNESAGEPGEQAHHDVPGDLHPAAASWAWLVPVIGSPALGVLGLMAEGQYRWMSWILALCLLASLPLELRRRREWRS